MTHMQHYLYSDTYAALLVQRYMYSDTCTEPPSHLRRNLGVSAPERFASIIPRLCTPRPCDSLAFLSTHTPVRVAIMCPPQCNFKSAYPWLGRRWKCDNLPTIHVRLHFPLEVLEILKVLLGRASERDARSPRRAIFDLHNEADSSAEQTSRISCSPLCLVFLLRHI